MEKELSVSHNFNQSKAKRGRRGEALFALYETRESEETVREIDKKIEAALLFKAALEGCRFDQPFEMITQTLDDALENAQTQFPEAQELLLQDKEVVSKIAHLGMALRRIEDQEKRAALETQLVAENAVRNTIRGKIERNRNASLLEAFSRLVDDCQHKNYYIREEIKTDTQLLAALEEELGRTIDPQMARAIERAAFSVNIILAPKYYHTIRPSSSNGCHLPGTPFNIIKDRGELRNARTIAHEDIHNFFETFAKQPASGVSSKVKTALERCVNEYGKKDTQQARRDALIQEIEDLGNPKDIVNRLHEEIVAAISRAEEREFDATDEVTHLTIALFGEDRELQESIQFIIAFSTAGSELAAIMKWLDEKQETADNPELKTVLNNAYKGIVYYFRAVISSVRDALGAAQRIDREQNDAQAHFKTHALLWLLKPSEYWFIGTYLKKKFGAERVEQLLAVASVIDAKDLRSESMKKLLSVKEKLGEEDQGYLREAIERQRVPHPVGKTSAEVLEYQNTIRELGRHLALDEELVNTFCNRAEANFVNDYFTNEQEKSAAEAHGDIDTFYDSLGEYGRGVFLEIFAEEILGDSEIIQEAAPRDLPFWKKVEASSALHTDLYSYLQSAFGYDVAAKGEKPLYDILREIHERPQAQEI